ncbi:thiamine-phosphate pyrophosphorylase [Helicobacter sp. MIT 05-5294]|uniref:thiamine-phosphate pyrophosphorylase n=1 Tax=Helicobacter sp. MIT 05-5294 TaxID=1548150 RepID=UPI00051F955E|nr:thiamine-phosphate pyrophosphorylase [Helicobacter sp. MIT 05-5294]TLD88113.1 thiamine-phosphate pyrophosphorylase [Helicobacter sp. MIT 05-5294]
MRTLRIMDANLNRLREGIRVIEDILRYGLNHQSFALTLKHLRHQCRLESYLDLLELRDSKNDVLKVSTKEEQSRENLQSVLIANFKRTQESARVLEEILKLDSIKESERFKKIRYELYELEKQVLLELKG